MIQHCTKKRKYFYKLKKSRGERFAIPEACINAFHKKASGFSLFSVCRGAAFQIF
jgi:hypothetical protein